MNPADLPDLSKTLPTRLRNDPGASRREAIESRDVAGDLRGRVSLERVELGAGGRGWVYEVNAEFDAVDGPLTDPNGNVTDPGGKVRRRDTLWLDAHEPARQLYLCAQGALSARTFEGDGGLSGLARQLGVKFTVQ